MFSVCSLILMATAISAAHPQPTEDLLAARIRFIALQALESQNDHHPAATLSKNASSPATVAVRTPADQPDEILQQAEDVLRRGLVNFQRYLPRNPEARAESTATVPYSDLAEFVRFVKETYQSIHGAIQRARQLLNPRQVPGLDRLRKSLNLEALESMTTVQDSTESKMQELSTTNSPTTLTGLSDP